MTPKFVGLYNYTHLAKDAVFVQSFKNNLLIAVITVPVSIALSAMMALFTEKVKFSRSFARLSFFYPTVLPMVTVANIWLFIYTRATVCWDISSPTSVCFPTPSLLSGA